MTNSGAPRHAVIVGLGLIGSSVGLALRRAGFHVTGSDADAGREARALELGVVDAVGSDPLAEVAFVATPVRSIAAEVAVLAAASERNDLVITDVGSVKGPIVAATAFDRYVGGHPMAGSEQEGPDGADADLFVGATWVLTPTSSTDPEAFAKVSALAALFGSEVIALPPDRHDALVALVSHVPHLVAANLMAIAADAAIEHGALLRLAAGGFRDMTRIAAGDPAIWPDIFSDNESAVVAALDTLRAQLDAARAMIIGHDRAAIVGLLEHAKSARRNLPARTPRPEDVVEFRVPITDRPGEIAAISMLLGEQGVNILDMEIAHSAEGTSGVLVLAIPGEVAEQARALLGSHGYRSSLQRLP